MTKRKLIVLVVWLALIGFFGGAEFLRDRGGGPAQAQSDQGIDAAMSSTALSDWPDCRSRESSVPVAKLCNAPSGAVELAAFRSIRERLWGGVNDTETLCQLDAEMVRSQRDCLPSQNYGDVTTIAWLMESLAYNWQRQGKPERAEELYRHAFVMLGSDELDFVPYKMGLLQVWTHQKLSTGDHQRAEELAALRVNLARGEYEKGERSKYLSARDLIAALKFQAYVLRRLGQTSKANATQQEANALAAQQPPCRGVCGEWGKKVK